MEPDTFLGAETLPSQEGERRGRHAFQPRVPGGPGERALCPALSADPGTAPPIGHRASGPRTQGRGRGSRHLRQAHAALRPPRPPLRRGPGALADGGGSEHGPGHAAAGWPGDGTGHPDLGARRPAGPGGGDGHHPGGIRRLAL